MFGEVGGIGLANAGSSSESSVPTRMLESDSAILPIIDLIDFVGDLLVTSSFELDDISAVVPHRCELLVFLQMSTNLRGRGASSDKAKTFAERFIYQNVQPLCFRSPETWLTL